MMSLIKISLCQRFVAYLLLINFVLQGCTPVNTSITPLKEEVGITSRPTGKCLKRKRKYQEEDIWTELELNKNCSSNRFLTFGTRFCLKNYEGWRVNKRRKLDPSITHSKTRLYKEEPNESVLPSSFHMLTTHKNRSLGISVDTSIHTTTDREDEEAQTYVQYDKDDICQEGSDFRVAAKTKIGKKQQGNYDGGHLVDHKFSAEGSHTDARNYVPQHHFYNRWIKEYLVKNAKGYLEIPIYTPNPPTIKVKGKDRYDPMPIGILLVTLGDGSIQDMYYFPNNQYDYRKVQSNLRIKNDMAREMSKLFKLKPVFHKFLPPAIVYENLQDSAHFTLQKEKEAAGLETVNSLLKGMQEPVLGEGRIDAIAALSSDVCHQQNVDVGNLLDINETQLRRMTAGQANPTAFNQSFNFLGQFLVKYAMKNALKSEVLEPSTHFKLTKAVTTFMEKRNPAVSEEVPNKVSATYGKAYRTGLEGLWEMKGQMSIEEVIVLAKLYQQLASDPVYHWYGKGHKVVKGMNLEKNTTCLMEILKGLYDKQLKAAEPDIDQMRKLDDLFVELQQSLILVDQGSGEKASKEEILETGKEVVDEITLYKRENMRKEREAKQELEDKKK